MTLVSSLDTTAVFELRILYNRFILTVTLRVSAKYVLANFEHNRNCEDISNILHIFHAYKICSLVLKPPLLEQQDLKAIQSSLPDKTDWFAMLSTCSMWHALRKLYTCVQPAGTILVTCWQHASNIVAIFLPTFWQHTGNMLATCWQHVGKMLATYKQHACMQHACMQHAFNMLACNMLATCLHSTCWQHAGNMLAMCS